MSRLSLTLLSILCLGGGAFAAELGPFSDLFPLTLASGHRTEAAGPFYYHEDKEGQVTRAFPPFYVHVEDKGVDYEERDFLYPIASYDRFGAEYRLHFFQLLNFAGGQSQEEIPRRRFTVFPFYFQQRSPNPDWNYTALMPFYGTLRDRLFRSEIHFLMMPAYVRTVKKEVTTRNYLYPFFHLRDGVALHGWQAWPVVGREEKGVTYKLNSTGDIETVGGYKKFFALWPFFFRNQLGLGTTNVEKQLTMIPFFATSHAPMRDSTTYFWPFGLTITDDRTKKYHEVGAPWPLIVFAHGEGKTTRRVWPLFSRAHNAYLESKFYLWPIYKFNAFHSDAVARKRTRIFFFLWSDIREWDPKTNVAKQRRDLWPFFTWSKAMDGKERLQVLAIAEPVLPNNKSIDRNWSHLWSLWRAEKNPKTGASSQSLLWNLYRRDTTPKSDRWHAFFGIVRREKTPAGVKWNWFWTGRKAKPAAASK